MRSAESIWAAAALKPAVVHLESCPIRSAKSIWTSAALIPAVVPHDSRASCANHKIAVTKKSN